MIHWHKWAEEDRQSMEKRRNLMPDRLAMLPEYSDSSKWPAEPWTLFLFRCSKCQAVKVTEVKGHWAK